MKTEPLVIKHPEKSLQDKYGFFSDLMNNIPDVIYFKDRDGRLIMVNEAHAKGLGLKPEEVAGKTDFDIFPKERAEKMAKDDLYVMTTGKPVIDKIERATRADGVDNYVSTTKIPRYNEKGEIIGLIGITRDITHRMQLEQIKEENEKIAEKLKRLEEFNKITSELISVVSHELKTPIAIIKESVMLILDGIAGPITEKQKHLLIKARGTIDRLKHIVDDLLDVSRIERGILQLHYSLVNLNDLIKDSAEFFKKNAEEKGIDLKWTLPAKQINIFIDTEKFMQVICNLLNNAIKFTDASGAINIETKIVGEKVRICVSDTGIGISKTDMHKLFGRFVQISKASRFQSKGLGLGLSIAKDLVEKHSGEIWAESKLGVGSRFYFTLPMIYTTKFLDSQVADRINEFLKREISLYLLNVTIIDFKEFKKKVINYVSRRLFIDINRVIENTIGGFIQNKKNKPEIAFRDYERGIFSAIFPGAKERDADGLCGVIKGSLEDYFKKNKIENVFVNIGIMPHPHEGMLSTTQHLFANLYLKKIFIGTEMRRYRRFYYKVDIEILHPNEKTEKTQTVDISQGGLCFTGREQLKTDEKVNIRMVLSDKKQLFLNGRIAWIKKLDEEKKGFLNRYKAGVEFIDIAEKDKKILSGLIKSIIIHEKKAETIFR